MAGDFELSFGPGEGWGGGGAGGGGEEEEPFGEWRWGGLFRREDRPFEPIKNGNLLLIAIILILALASRK